MRRAIRNPRKEEPNETAKARGKALLAFIADFRRTADLEGLDIDGFVAGARLLRDLSNC